MTMPAFPLPRTRLGARFHQFGGDAVAVVVDGAGREVSDRHPGTAYIAAHPDASPVLLFMDEHGGTHSQFTIVTRPFGPVAVQLRVDDDPVHRLLVVGGHVTEGWVVDVDWTAMYEEMR